MNDREQQELAARYSSWTDAALLTAVTTERGQYRPEVLPLLELEIGKRSLAVPLPSSVPPQPPSVSSASKAVLLSFRNRLQSSKRWPHLPPRIVAHLSREVPKRLWVVVVVIAGVAAGMASGAITLLVTTLIAVGSAYSTGHEEVAWIGFWCFGIGLGFLAFVVGAAVTAVRLLRREDRSWRTVLMIIGICVLVLSLIHLI